MSREYLRDAYPLTWPERQPRTLPQVRREGRFQLGLRHSHDELVRELKLLGANDIVISTNVPVRRDGLPYSDAREPEDPGVAVYFERFRDRGRTPYVIACDHYNRVKYNLRAIGLTIEALRSIERHGSTAMLEQAFSGFAQLPPASESAGTVPPWWVTLQVPVIATAEQINAAWRELARKHHPDVGGEAARMAEINQARDRGLAAVAAEEEARRVG